MVKFIYLAALELWGISLILKYISLHCSRFGWSVVVWEVGVWLAVRVIGCVCVMSV